MTSQAEFRAELLRQIQGISSSAVFFDLYHEAMADFEADPWPAIQLAIAILLDKPIVLAVLDGREPPKKLLGIADFVVYGASAEDIADQLKTVLDAEALE